MLNDTSNWYSWDTTAPTNTWSPIANFSGTFDGKGYSVSGAYINDSDGENIGRFGVNAGSIRNLGLEKSYICAYSFVGGIVGLDTNGIVGCFNSGKVVGHDTVGGVVGGVGMGVSVYKCYNLGDVVCSDQSAGGIAGGGAGMMNRCFNSRAISGANSIGGLVGTWVEGAELRDCYNAGSVTGTGTNIAGLVADSDGSMWFACNYNVSTISGPVGNTDALRQAGGFYLDTCGATGVGGTSLTDAQMQVAANFTNFVFTGATPVWTMAGNADYLYPEFVGLPYVAQSEPTATPIELAVTTKGCAARLDKAAIRFGASISFESLNALEVGDTLDYGFKINGLSGNALTSATWAKRSAASTAANFTGFTWTAEMDAATTPEQLATAIRASGMKVYAYDQNTITFAMILNNLPLGAQDSLWVFEPYATANETDISTGTIKYNSINRILADIASSTYTA